MIWEPFLLALVLGLLVSAGLYFAYLWPSVEPIDDDAIVPLKTSPEIDPPASPVIDPPPKPPMIDPSPNPPEIDPPASPEIGPPAGDPPSEPPKVTSESSSAT